MKEARQLVNEISNDTIAHRILLEWERFQGLAELSPLLTFKDNITFENGMVMLRWP